VASGRYVVERERHVEAPPELVRERIVDLRRWSSWSPWEGLDPDLDRTYGGPSSGVGSWYAWDGNRKAGKGRMEIVGADEREITIDLRFVKPFRSHSTTRFVLVPEGEGTGVTWAMTVPITLMTRVMGLVGFSMDRMIGPDFDKGLDRLKAESEASATD
jgi:hypothetical protein